jgi:hypothetical protein
VGWLAATKDNRGRCPTFTATRLSILHTLAIEVRDDRSGRKVLCAIQRSGIYDRIRYTFTVFPGGGYQNAALMADVKICDQQSHPIDIDGETACLQFNLSLRVGKIGCGMLAAKTTLASARDTFFGCDPRRILDRQSSAVAAAGMNMMHRESVGHVPISRQWGRLPNFRYWKNLRLTRHTRGACPIRTECRRRDRRSFRSRQIPGRTYHQGSGADRREWATSRPGAHARQCPRPERYAQSACHHRSAASPARQQRL